jgi:diguanylate cyclase (GGDEF)-like protein
MHGSFPSTNLDRVLDAAFRIDAEFQIQFVSEAGKRWLGMSPGDQLPRSFLDLLHPDDISTFQHKMPTGHQLLNCDARLLRGEHPCWVNLRVYALPQAQQFVVCMIDISSWIGGIAALPAVPGREELSGLAHRTFLQQAVEALIAQGNRPFVLALLDLDGLNRVNHNLGHHAGDAVLAETVQRLTRLTLLPNLVARLGGDEFVMLLPDKDAHASQALMQEVLFAIARPYHVAGHQAYLGASIGLAEFPGHGADYARLFNNADIAMHHAKSDGKNRFSVYAPQSGNSDFSIQAALYEGIEEGEFSLVYQPLFDMQRRIVGAEALMRWTSRTLGPVSPAEFIPIAEKVGLMPLLGKWALRYACQHLRRFQQLSPKFSMSVNVSPLQFGEDDFHVPVMNTVQELDIDPAQLVLEITESTLMQSRQQTELSLALLREQGIRIAIDDFGTGFSSLAYLTRFPVSGIKIDRSFVAKLDPTSASGDPDRKLIVAMIHLAHSIDLRVVAEGVETQAQFDFLKSAGCNFVQGYLLGRPMEAEVLLGLLDSTHNKNTS